MSDDDLVSLVLAESTDKMRKAVAHTREEFSKVRTGRASSALVERLTVVAYDVEMQLRELASFSVPEARMLVVTPFDKGTIGAIEKSIRNSDLGMNPSNDGHVIRLAFPPLTEERRKEFVKRVKQMAEEGKVRIRNERRSARHELEGMRKDGDISEDELTRAEKELNRITHTEEAAIDTALAEKERELLEV